MVMLTFADFEHLALQLGLSPTSVQNTCDSKVALFGFNIPQLKTVIKYLRTEKGARINLTGNKNALIDGIAAALWGNETHVKLPTPTKSAPPMAPMQLRANNVTIEHNVAWSQPSSSSKQTMNDPNFFEKQSPFFEHKQILASIPFYAREEMHPKSSFYIDEPTLALVKEKKAAVHARFFSKERKGDIPWNIDVVLRINSVTIDIQKLARKIRSKVFREPYILPRPADVSHTVRSHNTVEFCHPGESGVLILQVVEERSVQNLIAAVIAEKSSAGSRENMKSDDIEEMNYVLSMRCPLSLMRIETPVKSKRCTHEQCFDLKSYLEYSYQQQLWHCPVCDLGTPYKDLIYDEHFKKILASTNADKVTVYPDGTIDDADEPAAKKQKLNSHPSLRSSANGVSPPITTTTSTSTTAATSSPATPNPAVPPPPVIALLDSPPPSPSPPSEASPPTTTTSSSAPTDATSSAASASAPSSYIPPTTPATELLASLLIDPSQRQPPSQPATSSSSSQPQTPTQISPPQGSSPQQPSPPQVAAQVPPAITPNSTSATPTPTPAPPDPSKQDSPGLLKKILLKLPNWPPGSGAPANATSSAAGSAALTPADLAALANATSSPVTPALTPTTLPASLSSSAASPAGSSPAPTPILSSDYEDGARVGGVSASDAIVISDSDDE